MGFWNSILNLGKTVLDPFGAFGSGIEKTGSLIDTYSGKAGVDAQYEAIRQGAKNVADTNAANLAATRETNDLNYQLWREQQQLQRDFFDETNIYNSAAAQKQRLLDANFNPALAEYGGAGSVAAHTPNPTNAPQMVAPHMQAYMPPAVDYSSMQNALSNLFGAVKTGQEISKLKNDTAKVASDIEISKITHAILAENYTQETYNTNRMQFENDVKYSPEVKKAAINAVIQDYLLKATEASIKLKNKDFTERQLQAMSNKLVHEAISAKYDAEESKMTKGLYESIDNNLSGSLGQILAPVLKIMINRLGK